MCYHSLNIRIRSFTPCCATVLGKWANTPWWDLPSPWWGHGPSPKVTFGVMMPNAGVPPAWLHHHNTIVKAEESECEIEVTKLYCMDCASCWEDSWYIILVSWAQIPAWSCTHAVSLQHHKHWHAFSQPMVLPSLPVVTGGATTSHSRAGNSQWQNWWLWRASGRLCWPLPLTSGRPGLQRRLWDDGHHRSQMPELG